MGTVQITALIALFLFAAIMVCIGVLSARKAKTLDGFLLGGRNVGPWMAAFSYGTAYFSAVIMIGYAGKFGWDIGLGSIWIGIGNAVLGCLLAWLLLAKRTRAMTHNLGSRTMPEFFSSRFGDKKMKVYAAVIIFIFLVPYASGVYNGLGSMFGAIFPGLSIFGLDSGTVCMFIVALLTSVYLVLGGYTASSRTDFVQGIVMIVSVVLMVLGLVFSPQVGGPVAAIEKLSSVEGGQLTDIFGGKNFGFLCVNILLTSFGVWGMPQMVSKFYAIKSHTLVKTGTIVSTGFAIIIGCGAYFAGTLGRFFTSDFTAATPVDAGVSGGYDGVVPNMLMQAFSGSVWGSILLSLVLLCVLSASMSTLSAIVLSSASAISVDLAGVFRKNLQQKSQIKWTRILCFVFIALSFFLATAKISIIVTLMSFSWGVVAGCFIGPFIWGLWWKKTTKAGVWCGFIGGLATVVILTGYSMLSSPELSEGVFAAFKAASADAPVFGVTAMAVSVIIVPLVSLFTTKLPEPLVTSAFNPDDGLSEK